MINYSGQTLFQATVVQLTLVREKCSVRQAVQSQSVCLFFSSKVKLFQAFKEKAERKAFFSLGGYHFLLKVLRRWRSFLYATVKLMTDAYSNFAPKSACYILPLLWIEMHSLDASYSHTE